MVSKAIEKWAVDYPIENSHFDRASVIPDIDALRIGQESSVSSAVGDISQNVRDLSDRLNLYAMQLPQARWQAEYLLGEMRVNERLDSLDAQATALVFMANTMEQGTITVDIKSLRELHADILRLEILITQERGIFLSEVSRQRYESIKELERISAEMLQNAMKGGTDVVDHLMMRLAQIVGLSLVAIAIAAFFIVMLLRRRTS